MDGFFFTIHIWVHIGVGVFKWNLAQGLVVYLRFFHDAHRIHVDDSLVYYWDLGWEWRYLEQTVFENN